MHKNNEREAEAEDVGAASRPIAFLFPLRGAILLNLLHFLDNQWVIGCCKCYGLEPFLQRLEEYEEGGDDEEKAEGAEEHAADSAHAHRAATIGTGTRGEH